MLIEKIVFWGTLAFMFLLSFSVNPILFFIVCLVVFFFAFAFDGFVEMFVTYPLIKKYLIPEEVEEETVDPIFND